MKTKIKKNLIIALATLFLFAFFVLSALPLTYVNADIAADIASELFNSERYTNVLDDLQKDEKFNTDDYPAVKDDYSLKVIQIAESSSKELFVYTYQPAHETRDLIATSINISTGTGDELSYWNYELRLLSTNGVFDKYLVKDFKVSTEEVRTYDISNIYRALNKDIDTATGNDNTISEVGYKVGKCFYVKTDENGNVLYSATETDVVTITDKYVGYLSCTEDGSFLSIVLHASKLNDVHSHYVAFSTDKDIDKLLNVDILFTTQTYVHTYIMGFRNSGYGEKIKRSVTLSCDDTFTVDNGFFIFGNSTYTASCIRTVDDFLSKNDVLDDAKKEIENKQFVLHFFNSGHTSSSFRQYYRKYTGTSVTDVSVLRLEFQADGVVYNLGVVDNKQTGTFSGRLGKHHDCILWKLLAVLIIGGLLSWLLNQIFPWLYPLLGKIIKGVFMVIWYIISFKWLRDLIRWKKGKQPQQVVVVSDTNNTKRNRKGKKKPPTK